MSSMYKEVLRQFNENQMNVSRPIQIIQQVPMQETRQVARQEPQQTTKDKIQMVVKMLSNEKVYMSDEVQNVLKFWANKKQNNYRSKMVKCNVCQQLMTRGVKYLHCMRNKHLRKLEHYKGADEFSDVE